MKRSIIALAVAATAAFGTLAANAQTTVITQDPPASATVVVPAPETSTTTTTHERGGFLGTESKTTRTTTGSGINGDCSTRTVHKEDLTGEKTVSKTNCQ